MSQPTYIVNKIVVDQNTTFPYTLTPEGIQVVITTPHNGMDGIDSDHNILLEGDVNLVSRALGLSDRIELVSDQNQSYTYAKSRNILGDFGYIRTTWSALDILGAWADGKYCITDESPITEYYVESHQGTLYNEIRVRRQIPGYSDITISPNTPGATGTFHLEIFGSPITNSISFTDSDSIIEDIVVNLIPPYDSSWSTDYANNLRISIPITQDQSPYDGITPAVVVEEASAPNISPTSFYLYPYIITSGTLNPGNTPLITSEWDNLNNKSSHYSTISFPFGNPNFGDNDFSLDGGSNYANNNVTMYGCTVKGYSNINMQGAYAFLQECSLDHQVILDITALTGDQEIYGTFTGRPNNFDTIYLNDSFTGTIDLAAGRSTLRKTFDITLNGNWGIDADVDQFHHWAGEIYINNPDSHPLWRIENSQYLPDYFKIIIAQGQTLYFGQGNWATTYYSGTPITDGFNVGSYGQGGEVSFWREKDSSGAYTGRLLAYNVVMDYYYD